MGSAKDIHVAPISASDAAKIVKRVHYSGKVVQNSQLHFGVFMDGQLEGAMQFGPSMDKRKIQALVSGTEWNGFIELNRMAFSDKLPRNSESRALAIAFKIMRRHYPQLEWIVSFADGTQCGDGTIYRASGFVLTGIRENTNLLRLSDGTIATNFTLSKGKHILKTGGAKKPEGAKPLKGFQLRYVYFLNKEAKSRLTVPILPFSKIDEMGAGMYKSKARAKQAMASSPEVQRQGGTDPHAPNSEQV
jgi:hypothetical protein